ncbi:hypothetical protein HPB47_022184, partial [Ixodes persulcatus]
KLSTFMVAMVTLTIADGLHRAEGDSGVARSVICEMYFAGSLRTWVRSLAAPRVVAEALVL